MADPVRSVSLAFSVLRLLADEKPRSLSDISRSLCISLSSCLNILTTLAEEGALQRATAGKLYSLGPGWDSFETLREDLAASLAKRAQPLLDEFARKHHAAPGLWHIVSRDRVQLAAHAESSGGVRLRLEDGQRQPLGSGAVGRAFAAAQGVDEAELRRRHAPVRWHADLPLEAYRRQVCDAADRGYAIDRDYALPGISSVAVAVTETNPAFCLSASVFSGGRNEAELQNLAEALVRVSNDLLRQSGLSQRHV